jgi:hypothetical protein
MIFTERVLIPVFYYQSLISVVPVPLVLPFTPAIHEQNFRTFEILIVATTDHNSVTMATSVATTHFYVLEIDLPQPIDIKDITCCTSTS